MLGAADDVLQRLALEYQRIDPVEPRALDERHQRFCGARITSGEPAGPAVGAPL